ncbi:YicC/YloC family endoribonuclease [Bacillus sp. B1-b2]|uniref:YicC/YloC family endoribonuclease n=1 Tax=Bacillus sp. B1-b2 TaxID=2653201 RepID=UPI0012628EF7|nr:YicC/YloC family endoribonuclease [Bacillus sp. B1-b2]KAB7669229.1 YicC family protein [Bacillus sp. B1-b2]
MVKSMTGFGMAKKELQHLSIHIEIKSVNHRFIDLIFRMPKQFLYLEDQLKKIISNDIHRGRVEVYVTLESKGNTEKKIVVNWSLLDQYHELLTNLKERYTIKESISLQDLVSKEDCFELLDHELDTEELASELVTVFSEAVVQLEQMRKVEGLELKKDLISHLKRLESLLSRLQEVAPQVVEQYREKLKARLDKFLIEPVDETRLIAEVAIFADKADINEELVRLTSHIQQFYFILEETTPVGRKLDFLLQEMNREINTIGSKANSSVIGTLVVESKSCLEKIKEQIQNIE